MSVLKLSGEGCVPLMPFCSDKNEYNSLLVAQQDATRVWDLYTYFRDAPGGGNYTTLPEMFRLNGYETIGMGVCL